MADHEKMTAAIITDGQQAPGPFVCQADILDAAFTSRQDDGPWLVRKPDNGWLALLRTCKIIYAEANPIFEDSLVLSLGVEDGKAPYLNDEQLTCVGELRDWTALK
ncbi:hypothetical protein LTR65_010004 [Meristemomyces frigidus]